MINKNCSTWEIFIETVEKYYNYPAFKDINHNTLLTWGDYYILAKKFAERLLALEFKPKECVFISGNNSPEICIANMGTLAIGGVVSHIRMDRKEEEFITITYNANATIYVLENIEHYYHILNQVSNQVKGIIMLNKYIDTHNNNNMNNNKEMLPKTISNIPYYISMFSFLSNDHLIDNNIINFIYNSNNIQTLSTITYRYNVNGVLQGAMLTHENIIFTSSALSKEIGPLTLHDRIIGFLPLFHITSQIIEIYLPLYSGTPVYFISNNNYNNNNLLSIIYNKTYNKHLSNDNILKDKYKINNTNNKTKTKTNNNYSNKSNIKKKYNFIEYLKKIEPTIFFASPATYEELSKIIFNEKIKKNINKKKCYTIYSIFYKWAKNRAISNSRKLQYYDNSAINTVRNLSTNNDKSNTNKTNITSHLKFNLFGKRKRKRKTFSSFGIFLSDIFVFNKIKKKIGLYKASYNISNNSNTIIYKILQNLRIYHMKGKGCYCILAQMDLDLLNIYNNNNINIFQLFGLPETCGFHLINKPFNWIFGSYGRPLIGTELEINNNEKNNIQNEVLVKGSNIFNGYLHNDIATNQVLYSSNNDNNISKNNSIININNNNNNNNESNDKWYHSSYSGHINPDGYLLITENIKNFIILSTGEIYPPILDEKAIKFKLLNNLLLDALIIGDSRPYLSVIFIIKTVLMNTNINDTINKYNINSKNRNRSISSSSTTSTNSKNIKKKINKYINHITDDNINNILHDDVIKKGFEIGSKAIHLKDLIKCPLWAIHFDHALEKLNSHSRLTSHQIRKYIILNKTNNSSNITYGFSVQDGELDPNTNEPNRAFIQRKFKYLIDTIY